MEKSQKKNDFIFPLLFVDIMMFINILCTSKKTLGMNVGFSIFPKERFFLGKRLMFNTCFFFMLIYELNTII